MITTATTYEDFNKQGLQQQGLQQEELNNKAFNNKKNFK